MPVLTNLPFLKNFLLPALDIILLAYLLYKLYELLEETKAVHLLRGAVILALVYALAWGLQLSTMLWILQFIAPGFFIGIAIVFQPELRNIVSRIGQRELFRGKMRQKPFQIDAVINAVEVLANNRRGALVVFGRKVGLKDIISTGTIMEAELSSALLLTIFGYDGPLHDGAVVIQGGKIAAAGCFLPLSSQMDILKIFGTRHRAALGMAEETDAVTLVVSEETGALSLAYDNNILYDLEVDGLKRQLGKLMSKGSADKPEESGK
ncbi:MAG: TIGR00159 family protein [Spirochaeta sp. LUC14_002_19_P3]|nr:MAG: TIGR00159 family protein [Spirochaeta sp. LUC14_002_19_P3]